MHVYVNKDTVAPLFLCLWVDKINLLWHLTPHTWPLEAWENIKRLMFIFARCKATCTVTRKVYFFLCRNQRGLWKIVFFRLQPRNCAVVTWVSHQAGHNTCNHFLVPDHDVWLKEKCLKKHSLWKKINLSICFWSSYKSVRLHMKKHLYVRKVRRF